MNDIPYVQKTILQDQWTIVTGNGSRKISQKVYDRMYWLGWEWAKLGYCLRSGGADGSDTAFEKGYKDNKGPYPAIYLPWKGFNKRASPYHEPSEEAFELALQFHPKPDLLRTRTSIWALMARNAHQVLGLNLDRRADLIVCYCRYTKHPDGTKTYEGGTGQALRMADFYEIPVLNLYDEYGDHDDLLRLARTIP